MANGLAKAVMIGVAAGMRCFLAPAMLMRGRREETCDGRFCSVSRTSIIALAAAELVGDKTSYIGNRTDAGPLFGRAVSGAVCGAIVSKQNGGDSIGGLVAGGLAAIASAHACYLTRRELARLTGTPDIVLALAEDAAALSLAAAASDRTGAT
ncbi:MAG: DUF4126 domain-containing protein [Acidobacteria bacterium]|nr:DUF4126 domain-containing protein [Acidobacteriota bacterium]